MAQGIRVISFADRFEIPDGIHYRMVVPEDVVEDGIVLHELRFLFEEGDIHVLVPPELSAVSRIPACQDLHQGGFSGAIASYKGDLVAFLDMKGDAGEQGLDAVGFGEGFDGQIMHAQR